MEYLKEENFIRSTKRTYLMEICISALRSTSPSMKGLGSSSRGCDRKHTNEITSGNKIPAQAESSSCN